MVFAGVSAFAAALHELCWSSLVARWVGGVGWSIALTLAMFMLGQGLGALASRNPRWMSHPLRFWALGEGAVGAFALGATMAFGRVAPPSGAVAQSGTMLGVFVDVGCAVVVVAPASLAMGAVFPLLVGATEGEEISVAGLYRAGLIGACVGVLFGAVCLGPWVGFITADALAAIVNLGLCAVGLWLLSKNTTLERGDTVGTEGETGEPEVPVVWGALRFGAVAVLGLGAQTLWHRTVVPYAGLSALVFAAVVAVYLAGQAMGFWGLSKLDRDRRERAGRVCLAVVGPLGVLSFGALSIAARVAPSREAGAIAWVMGTLSSVALVVLATAFVLGVAQGSVLDEISSRTSHSERGRSVGRVTGYGTALGALGSVAVVGLLPWVGPRWSMALLSLPCVLVLALEKQPRLLAVSVLTTLGVALWAPGPRNFLGRDWDRAEVLSAKVGLQDTMAVIVHDRAVEPRLRQIVSNGVAYAGDSLFAQRYMRVIGHLGALTARRRERALVVCVGTGTTVDALLRWPFESIDAVDIDPDVTATLRWFEGVNHGVWRSPRVRWITDDGVRFVRTSPTHWDVIALEPPPPRAAGGSALYSVDFYRAARERLSQGGVLAQWLPLHDQGGWEAAVVVRTFLSVFPRGGLYLVERNEAVLLSNGARSAVTDLRPEELAMVGYGGRDPVRDSFAVSAEGLRETVGEGPYISLAWPLTEMVPLAGEISLLSGFSQRLSRHSVAMRESSAEAFLSALPAFVRVREEHGDVRAMVEAQTALAPWLRAHPGDPYVQYMLGYGPWLENRLDRVATEGTPRRVIDALREVFRRRRAAHGT